MNSRRSTADTRTVDGSSSAALAAMVVGDALGAIPRPMQAGVLALMIGCALWVAVLRSGPSVVGFLACALLWSRANQALEGPVLLTVTPEHGITAADLWPPALALLSGWRLVRRPLATSDDGAGSGCVAADRTR